MRVALISARPPGFGASMGIYADLVLAALQRHAPEVQAAPVSLLPQHPAGHRQLAGRAGLLIQMTLAWAASRRVQADVVHLLDGSFGYMAGGLPLRRTLVTVHDMIPALQMQGRFPCARPGWAARQLIGASLGVVRRAGGVHAISHCTARDVAALTGRPADVVVHNPLREWAGEPAMPASVPAGAFVLHVGHNAFYKNRAGVLEIFARVATAHPGLHLVMAGPAPTPQLAERARALGLGTRLQWMHDPGSAQLAWLYGHAGLLLFPSLYEGFGWPPLEALQHGCPVVCADTGSLPEVVGDAAVVWPPTDIDGFAQQALRVLGDRALARTMVANGQARLRHFTAQRLVEGLLPLYKRLAQA